MLLGSLILGVVTLILMFATLNLKKEDARRGLK